MDNICLESCDFQCECNGFGIKPWAFIYSFNNTETMWSILEEAFMFCGYILDVVFYESTNIFCDTFTTTDYWSRRWYMVVGLVNL